MLITPHLALDSPFPSKIGRIYSLILASAQDCVTDRLFFSDAPCVVLTPLQIRQIPSCVCGGLWRRTKSGADLPALSFEGIDQFWRDTPSPECINSRSPSR